MAHEPTNPFQQLVKAFSSREKDKDQPPASAPRPSGGRGNVPRTAAAKHAVATRDGFPFQDDDDDDSSLFLNAMSGTHSLQNTAHQDSSPNPGRRQGAHPEATRPLKRRELHGSSQDLPADCEQKSDILFPEQTLAARLRETQTSSSTCQATGTASAPAASKQRPGFPPSGENAARSKDNQPEPAQAMRAALNGADTQGGNDAPQTRRQEEELLFAKAMQGVAPVITKGREVPRPAGKKGEGVPAVDPAKALRDLLEGRVEFALHHTDEFVEGYVVGLDPLVLARLRSGQFSPEAHLDLHGQNANQALNSLSWFIKNAYQRGLRTVLVVTGRGKNSPDGVGVLRPLLQRWLSREPFKRVVLAFCTAKPADGGPGAVYVLLRKYKKSRGKIIWEHCPSDDDFPDI